MIWLLKNYIVNVIICSLFLICLNAIDMCLGWVTITPWYGVFVISIIQGLFAGAITTLLDIIINLFK